jgi:hypothetical protein
VSGPGWHKVSDVRSFMAEKGQRKERVHAFTKRACSWPYCAHCGLVLLKNDATRKAAKQACITFE